jgi:hypothetical protein
MIFIAIIQREGAGVAKAFDLVHKVADSKEPESDESKIPFEDEEPNGSKDPAPKRRVKVEVIFFYLLLFAIFFVMGAMFLSPGIFGSKKVAANPSPSASPGSTPDPGFTIDKEGQSNDEANKALQSTSSPTPNASTPATTSSPSTAASPATTTSKAAKIQIMNGTTTEGKAASFRTKLASKGIVVASIGNYHKRTVARTTIYYTADYKTAAAQVQAIVGGLLVQTTSSTTGTNDILIVVGKSS